MSDRNSGGSVVSSALSNMDPIVPEIVPMMSQGYIPPNPSLVGNYEKKQKGKSKEFRKRSDSLKSQQSLWRLDPDTTGALPRDGYIEFDMYDAKLDPERQSRISYESFATNNGTSTTTSASQSRRSSVRNVNGNGIAASSSASSSSSSSSSSSEYDMDHNTSQRNSVASQNKANNIDTNKRQSVLSQMSNGGNVSNRNSVVSNKALSTASSFKSGVLDNRSSVISKASETTSPPLSARSTSTLSSTGDRSSIHSNARTSTVGSRSTTYTHSSRKYSGVTGNDVYNAATIVPSVQRSSSSGNRSSVYSNESSVRNISGLTDHRSSSVSINRQDDQKSNPRSSSVSINRQDDQKSNPRSSSVSINRQDDQKSNPSSPVVVVEAQQASSEAKNGTTRSRNTSIKSRQSGSFTMRSAYDSQVGSSFKESDAIEESSYQDTSQFERKSSLAQRAATPKMSNDILQQIRGTSSDALKHVDVEPDALDSSMGFNLNNTHSQSTRSLSSSSSSSSSSSDSSSSTVISIPPQAQSPTDGNVHYSNSFKSIKSDASTALSNYSSNQGRISQTSSFRETTSPPQSQSPTNGNVQYSMSFKSTRSDVSAAHSGSTNRGQLSQTPSFRETTVSRNTSHASSLAAPSMKSNLSSTLLRNQNIDSSLSRSESNRSNASKVGSYSNLASASPYVSRNSSSVSDKNKGSFTVKSAGPGTLTRKTTVTERTEASRTPSLSPTRAYNTDTSQETRQVTQTTAQSPTPRVQSPLAQNKEFMQKMDSLFASSSTSPVNKPKATTTTTYQMSKQTDKLSTDFSSAVQVQAQEKETKQEKKPDLTVNVDKHLVTDEQNDKPVSGTPLSPRMEMEQIMKNKSTVSKLRIDFKDIPLTGRVVDPSTLERQKKSTSSPNEQKYKFLVEGIDTPAVEGEEDAPPPLPTSEPPTDGGLPVPPPPPPPLPPGLMNDLNTDGGVTSPIKKKGFAYVMDSALSEKIIKRAEDVTSRKPHEFVEEIHSKREEEYNAAHDSGEISTLREARDKLHRQQKRESYEQRNSGATVSAVNIDINQHTEDESTHAYNSNNVSASSNRNMTEDIKQVTATSNTDLHDTIKSTTSPPVRNKQERTNNQPDNMPGITQQSIYTPVSINMTQQNDSTSMAQQMMTKMSSVDDPGHVTVQQAYSDERSGQSGQALYQAKQQFLHTQREGMDQTDNVTTVTKQDKQQFVQSYTTTEPRYPQNNNNLVNSDPPRQHYQKASQSQQQRTNHSTANYGQTLNSDSLQRSPIERQRDGHSPQRAQSTSADGKLFIEIANQNSDYDFDETLSGGVASPGTFNYYDGTLNNSTLQSGTTTSSFFDVTKPLSPRSPKAQKTRIVPLKPLTIEINDNLGFTNHAMKSYATYISPGTLAEQPLSPRKITVLKQHQQERHQGQASIRINGSTSHLNQQPQRLSGDLESFQYEQNERKSRKRHKGRHVAKIHIDGAVTDAYSDWEGASAYSEPAVRHVTRSVASRSRSPSKVSHGEHHRSASLNRDANTRQFVYGGSQHIATGDMVTSSVIQHNTGYDGFSSVSQPEVNMMDTQSVPVTPVTPTMLQPMLEDASQHDGNYHITLKLNQHGFPGGQPIKHTSSMRSQNSQWSSSMSVPDGDDQRQNYKSHIRVDNSDSGSTISYDGFSQSKFVSQVQQQGPKPAFAMGIGQTMTMDYAAGQENQGAVQAVPTQQPISPQQQPSVQNTSNTYYNSSNSLQQHYYGNNNSPNDGQSRAISTQTPKKKPVRSVDDYFEDPEHRRRQKRKNKRQEYEEMADYFSPAEEDDYVNRTEEVPQLVTGSILIENMFDSTGKPVHMDLVDGGDDFNVEDNPNLYADGYLQHRENPMYSSDEELSRPRKSSRAAPRKPSFTEVFENTIHPDRQRSLKRQPPPPRYEDTTERVIHQHTEENFHSQKGLPTDSDVVMDIPVGYQNGYDRTETVQSTTTHAPRKQTQQTQQTHIRTEVGE